VITIDVVQAALIDDEGSSTLKQRRIELLQTASEKDTLLEFHLGIVSLFATCAEGGVFDESDRFVVYLAEN
jgi:hypothetical protein